MTEANDTPRPLCFVLMPFGKKPDGTARTVDFDEVYSELIRPAVEAAGLEPLRGDEEMVGGLIHSPMFQRLLLCPYAVADLTSGNANVYYELGVRHAFRPYTTTPIYAKGTSLPFDLGPVRGLRYSISEGGRPDQVERDRTALTERLRAAQERSVDSPIYGLLHDLRPPDISRLKTDVFREHVQYSEEIKARLENARTVKSVEAVDEVRDSLDLGHQDAGVAVDLLLSYRAVKGWQRMIDLVEALTPPIARTKLIQEQYGLALNRAGQDQKAERVLKAVIDEFGPSSETCGILGRVYKDRWENSKNAGQDLAARGHLKKAIDTYLQGFQADWRDAYPGINCLTLMELADPPDERRHELLPLVTYAVQRRIETTDADYWDYATLLELAILAEDRERAEEALADTLSHAREPWEPETTARNLRLISEHREQKGKSADWCDDIERELDQAKEALSNKKH